MSIRIPHKKAPAAPAGPGAYAEQGVDLKRGVDY